MICRLWRWIPVAAGLTAATFLQGALQIDGFTTGQHDRFDNDPAFIAGAYDLSGLGINASGRWGSLVSGNVVLSAFHFFPAIGSDLIFHAANDPSGPSVSRTVLAGQRIGASDIWVGILSDPVPAGYVAFAFTGEAIPDAAAFASSSHAGQPVYMVGRSPTGFPVVTDAAVGANVANEWEDSVSASGTTDQALIAYRDLPGDPGYVTGEAFLQVGDSGAPLLRDINGELFIIGLNWFIGQVDLDPRPRFQDLRDISGFSYVGNYAASIQAVVDAFIDDPSQGYEAWRPSAFGGTTDLALTGPSADFDGDGLINFLEYAFALDPLDAAATTPLQSSRTEVDGAAYLQVAFDTRDDVELSYAIQAGDDFSGWSTTSLLFSAGQWSSSDPATLVLQSATSLGNGRWRLVLRDATPLAPASPRLIRLAVQ